MTSNVVIPVSLRARFACSLRRTVFAQTPQPHHMFRQPHPAVRRMQQARGLQEHGGRVWGEITMLFLK